MRGKFFLLCWRAITCGVRGRARVAVHRANVREGASQLLKRVGKTLTHCVFGTGGAHGVVTPALGERAAAMTDVDGCR